MANLVRTYINLLHRRPFITNVLTTCSFMTGGDVMSQLFLQNKGTYDLKQTLRFGIAGLIFIGPVVRGSLVTIDKLFGPTNSIKTLVKKLLVDQGLCAPTFLAGNIVLLSLLRDASTDEAKRALNDTYLDILKANYSFWPFIQVINFYFIPLTYRVLFGSTAALAWSTILSLKIHGKEPETGQDK